MLQKVVRRWPVPAHLDEDHKDYLICWCVETLACGHQITVYREADLLIAVRRDCKRCDPAATVPKKKPSRVSVNSESEEEIA